MIIRTLLVFFTCLFSFLLVPSSYAHPERLACCPPPPRYVDSPPPGCRNCFLMAPSYGCGVWSDQHYECYYNCTPDVWISAHWQCSRYYPTTGICGSWQWIPSYWLRRPVAVTPCAPPPPCLPPPPPPVVYGPPPPVVYGPPPPVIYAPPPPVVYGAPPAFFFGYSNGCRHHHHRCW